ncbi:hypothetical protein F2Q69_00062763 [Brassica cretica]|uniref:Uncharacterized protein n=1 Tax=Brassica cretica TaxID=69181 RepID=A0A8S9RII2_BRACR|nr:hypothetical protein F2Q69_00062763 [Brassica cretica]
MVVETFILFQRLPCAFLGEMSKLCFVPFEVSLHNGPIQLSSSTSSLIEDGCVLKVLSGRPPVLSTSNINVEYRGLLYVQCWTCVNSIPIYRTFSFDIAVVAIVLLAILAIVSFSFVLNFYSILGD